MRTIHSASDDATPFCPKRLNLRLVDEYFIHPMVY